MNLSDLENKRLAVWGMGKEGAETIRFLWSHFPGKPLTLIDREMPENIPDVGPMYFIREDDLDKKAINFDVVIKSPGISLYHPCVKYLKDHHVTVTSATNIWFAQPRRGKVIAITGSNGKSTSCALLDHILKDLGQTVELGGNIGKPLLSLEADADYYIAELSSYQTADLCYAPGCMPDIAVLLNLFPEHIQWHQTHAQYYIDKSNLIRAGAGSVVLNHTDPLTKEKGPKISGTHWFNDPEAIHIKGEHIQFGEKRLGDITDITLLGRHNHENICAALTVCQILGLDLTECFKLAATYPGLPHRLENLGLIKGRTYINDSISTTPEATIAALKCFEGRAVTLLIGGQDRQQDFTALALYIKHHPELNIITSYETGPKISMALEASDVTSYVAQAAGLEDGVKCAQKITPKGGIILLSPAAPSYDGFKNYEHRGETFKLFSQNTLS